MAEGENAVQEVIMPKAGMSMEEGTVVRWLKAEGEPVQKGEPLLEIETDKAVMELEAEASGILLKILAQEGETVPVTEPIAYIGGKGETTPLEQNVARVEINQSCNERSDIAPAEQKMPALQNSQGRAAATPLARKLAADKGVDIANVKPSGRLGEVKARDIEAMTASLDGKVMASPTLYNTEYNTENALKKPMTAMRRTIAKRMLKSHLEIPPVTIDMRADVTGLCRLREQLNGALDTKITYNDFIIWATAAALRQSPEINVSFVEEHLIYHQDIHIGIAVAVEDGLIVPVMRNADRFKLTEIAAKSKELADKARRGALQPEEYSGGTFTISNMGMYGVRSFTPIINQPESAILGVCAIEPGLAMDENGIISQRQYMGLSLTFDHRCMDGVLAAHFLQRIIETLEHPMVMLIS